MVFNATNNNISVISLRSVLLLEVIGVFGKKTTDMLQVTDKVYHKMWYRVYPTCVGFEFTSVVVLGTGC